MCGPNMFYSFIVISNISMEYSSSLNLHYFYIKNVVNRIYTFSVSVVPTFSSFNKSIVFPLVSSIQNITKNMPNVQQAPKITIKPYN